MNKQKIRELLEKALRNSSRHLCNVSYIKEAIALLDEPCPTCEDSGEVELFSNWPNLPNKYLCPDCSQKEK